MVQDKFGQMIFDESDIVDSLMSNKDRGLDNTLVASDEKLKSVLAILENPPEFKFNNADQSISVESFDKSQQQVWHFPESFKQLDIAEYVLSLCDNDAEIQRCGEELLLYQERNLFMLLKYLHYLVTVMTNNKIIWGVGRGSSTASFVLYKLRVHRINSLFYQIPIGEFLR